MADKNFIACPVEFGDEVYANGICEFNITRLLAYIAENPAAVQFVELVVSEYPAAVSAIEESHIDAVDISRPVVLAEIAPGRYNLIDGNHRLEKARRLGVPTLRACKLHVRQHMPFLISKKAYLSYIEYWNGKLS